MKDILITLDNGKPIFDESFIGINRENLQKNLIFAFKDTFIEGVANLEIKIDDEEGVITNLEKVNNTYILPIRDSLLTSDKILMQLVIYQAEVDEETPIYKSEIIYMKVKDSLNATGTIPDEYPTWTETLGALYLEVQELMQETETALENIPTKTSDLTNDSGFITKNVNDLEYYSKTSAMNMAIFTAVSNEASLRQNADNNLQSQIDAITSASDVVDVVGTYQELLDYDTSSLTDNDIIKVLDDSTHDNATSYYRWNNNTWNYLGSEGSFYTKAETDALLNEKQNKIDSSHKLSSDLVDDTGHTNKFATAEQLSQISTNASNISDIQTSLNNKEDKANKVTSISASSTDTEYPSAKCVYDSQVAQDNKTNEIENKVEYYATIMNALPKISGTGTSITLDNTANSPMELELQPSELEQETTTGKNIRDIYNMSYVAGGSATVTKANGNITIAGTSASYASAQYTQANLNLSPNTTYTLSAKIVSTTNSNGSLVYVNPDMSSTGSQIWGSQVSAGNRSVVTFTTPATISNTAFIGLYTGGTSNTAVFTDIQLEIGSSATDYEPYTGGIASPNPDFPQDIHVISGDNKIKVINKNLFDVTQFEALLVQNKRLNDNGEEVTDNSSWYSTYKIPLTANVQYHIKGVFQRIYFYDSTGSFIRRSSDYGSNTNITYTPTNNEYIGFQIYVTNWNNNKGQEQVEIGSSATSYIEHKEQDFSITLGDLEYCKIGDYADEFIKATNETGLTAGKWYLKKNIGKLICNGTENWIYNSGNALLILTDDEGYLLSSFTPICSHYIGQSSVSQYSAVQDYHIATQLSTNNRLLIKDTNFSSASSYKTWLSSHNVSIYYPLETPTYTLLNNTLQEQLETIYNYALGYKDQTNINQTNAYLPFIINARAVKDLSNL